MFTTRYDTENDGKVTPGPWQQYQEYAASFVHFVKCLEKQGLKPKKNYESFLPFFFFKSW
jgi:hypothetical protein